VRSKIKCGVIGAGWWATYAHIPALLANPEVELVGIQNNDRVEAGKIAQDFSVRKACLTVEELLSLDGLEAVVVSSSPNLHYPNVKAALERGKHVLVEKPMTLTVAQADELLELSERTNLRLMISCPWHYTQHATEARNLVRSGQLGEVRMISMLMTNPVSGLLRGTNNQPTHGTPYMHPRPGTYSDPEISGGGQMYAQVCHAAAYLTYLTGARATEVFAQVHNDGATVDIYDAIVLRMDNSSIVNIASTGATSLERKDFEVRIFGTKGILYLDLWNGRMEYVSLSGERRTYPDLLFDSIYPHRAPVNNFIESISDAQRNLSPAIFGVAAMEVVEGASYSVKTNKNILISSFYGSTHE